VQPQEQCCGKGGKRRRAAHPLLRFKLQQLCVPYPSAFWGRVGLTGDTLKFVVNGEKRKSKSRSDDVLCGFPTVNDGKACQVQGDGKHNVTVEDSRL
jgi:hypothetical protein